MNKILHVLLCASLCLICESGRILVVVPTPSISHQVPFRPLTLELAKRGHQVTVVTTDPIYPVGEAPENFTEIDLHDVTYAVGREFVTDCGVTNGRRSDMLIQMDTFKNVASRVLEIHMTSEVIQNTLKNEKFDLLILEAGMRPFILYSHILKGVPVIIASSYGVFNPTLDMMGAPTRPTLLYPNLLSQKLSPVTVWEKVKALYDHYMVEDIFARQVPEDEKVMRKLLGEDTPTISELEKNIDLLLLNMHPIWYLNRPVPPNIVYIGGIVKKPVQRLPKNLKSYLDASEHGVIYFSYGTNVNPSTLPQDKIQILKTAFSKLPYDVLWKWDKDELIGITDNINITKWVPQSDLLKHPKVKLFITQGGLQSTDEAILAGVPLIGMPMLGDQWFNVEQYVHHKIGIRLDFEDLTEEKVLNAINTLVNDESYRKNVLRLRSLMYDQPQSALSRAVWWTEHVLRHGGRHLRAPAANLSWGEYLDVQLLATLAIGLFITITLAVSAALLLVVWFKNYLSLKQKKE